MKKLDLLFVTDTNECGDHKRLGAAQAMGDYVQNLPSGGDYRVGVMLGHASTEYAGQLYTAGRGGPVLRSDMMSRSAMGTEVAYRLTHVQREHGGGEGRALLYSAWKSMTTNLAALQAQGFYRPDAALAIIFVSDIQDMCTSSGLAGYATYCNGINRTTFLAKVKELKGSLPFKIGYDHDSGLIFDCPEGLRFVMGNTCDYDTDLKDIYCLINAVPQLKKRFALKIPSSKLNRGSIKVYVNGVLVDTWSYDPSDSSVLLADCTPGLGPCATVVIKYCDNG